MVKEYIELIFTFEKGQRITRINAIDIPTTLNKSHFEYHLIKMSNVMNNEIELDREATEAARKAVFNKLSKGRLVKISCDLSNAGKDITLSWTHDKVIQFYYPIQSESDEWFCNNLSHTIKGQQELVNLGKQEQIDRSVILDFIKENQVK